MTEQNDDNTHIHVVLAKDTMVQHYRIIEKIGAGGMGEVYLAEDTKLKRKVAMKFLPHHFINNESIKTRFQREAQAVAKLNHPNIVTIHEVSDFNGRPFFVMENIDGNSLHHFIKEETLSIDSIIEYAIQTCQGLGEAHRNGIIHRDIKPANIAVDNTNRIKLLDFGLATSEGDEKLTKTGSTLGTVAYMSPEQVSGRDIDHRSDLFSLGIVLYELLCGRTPFKKDNEGATLKAIIENDPEPLCRYKSEVPDKLQEIIFQLIEKDKELRYQSAEGVIADLKRLMYDSQQYSHASSKREESLLKKSSFKMAVAAAVIVIAVAVGYMNYGSEPEEVEKKIPVLIVLPFENVGSSEDDYFADGIRDIITSRLLTRVKGLRVISPRSADRYKKNEDNSTELSIAEIGKETGADYVLEATIRWDKSGDADRILIIPRLSKTSDNYLMWADNYDKKLIEIFEVQSEIAEQIVTALGLTLVDTDKPAPEYAETKNMAAFNFYLKGLEVSSHTFNMSDFNESIIMFDSAIALDSSFALAWAQKSINHSTYNFFFTTVDAKYHKEEALKAAEMALELDPNLPSAKIAMGTYYNYIEKDYDNALEQFYSAESEITSDAELSMSIGIVYMRQGRWQDALVKLEEAVQIDPLNGRRYFYLSNCLSMTRDYDAANAYLDRARVLEPDNADAAFMTIFINLLEHGTVDSPGRSFEKIASDAGLADLSTYELASSSSLGLWRFIIDRVDPKETIEKIRKLGKVRDVINERSPHIIHINIGQIYDLTGHHDSALVQYDSAVVILKNIIDRGGFEFHSLAELGVTYAMMGNKEEAIKYGKAAKEDMPIEECYW